MHSMLVVSTTYWSVVMGAKCEQEGAEHTGVEQLQADELWLSIRSVLGLLVRKSNIQMQFHRSVNFPVR